MSPTNLLSLYFLTMLRIAPIIIFTPFFGGQMIPGLARVAQVLAYSLLLMPTVIGSATFFPDFNFFYIFATLKEFIIGFMFAFLVNAPFYTVQSSGIIIDYERGASMMMQQDPSLKLQISTLGVFFNQFLVVVFFVMGGPFFFFDGFVTSYSAIPVDGILHPNFFNLNNPFWMTLVTYLNDIFTMGVQFAAPAIIAVLMAESFLGIANRLAPQVQIVFLGMSLKSFLAMLLLWAGWYLFLKTIGDHSIDMTKAIKTLFEGIPYYNIK